MANAPSWFIFLYGYMVVMYDDHLHRITLVVRFLKLIKFNPLERSTLNKEHKGQYECEMRTPAQVRGLSICTPVVTAEYEL